MVDRQTMHNKASRRKVLKAIGISVVTPIMAVNTAAQKPFDSSRVKWSDDASVLQFANRINELDSEDQRDIIEGLSIEQEEAIARAYGDNMRYVRHQTFSADENTAVVEGDSLDTPVSPDGVPALHKESVAGVEPIGGKKYEFFHTINWVYDGNGYRDTVSSIRGETYDVFFNYLGPDTNNLTQYSSFFDWYRAGKFSFDIPGGYEEFFPHIELRGKANGGGVTLSKDSDYPEL